MTNTDGFRTILLIYDMKQWLLFPVWDKNQSRHESPLHNATVSYIVHHSVTAVRKDHISNIRISLCVFIVYGRLFMRFK